MITILPYQRNWPDEFARVGAHLRHALGELVIRVDHIGSTSVPGLAAKDVIDVQITVHGLTSELNDSLTNVGWHQLNHITCDHVPPNMPTNPDEWCKWFYKSPSNERPLNLHARIVGRLNQRYALLFRDFLRYNSMAAAAYAQVKLALVSRHPGDVDAYYDVKDPVCDIIMAAAEAWAEQTKWKPGPSDQ